MTSQKDRILNHLKKYGSITQKDAWELYGASRLSAIIYNLKHKEGYNITTQTVQGKNRYGETTYFGVYTYIDEMVGENIKHIPSII